MNGIVCLVGAGHGAPHLLVEFRKATG